jgi:hypothetical protein
MGLRMALATMAMVELLAGCQTDPTTSFTAIETGYMAALTGEIAYLNTPSPNRAIVVQMQMYQTGVHDALAPIQAEIAAGTAPASEELLAAQIALNTLTVYMTSNGVAVPTGGQ